MSGKRNSKKGGQQQQQGGKGKGKAGPSGGGGGGKGKGAAEKSFKEVKCRHILCEKWGKMETAVKRVKGYTDEEGNAVKPEKFNVVATELSEDAARDGGNLGWGAKGNKWLKAFEDVAFATPVGSISEPFKTKHGWHIILVEGRR